MHRHFAASVLVVAVSQVGVSSNQRATRSSDVLDANGAPAVEERSWNLRGISGEAVGVLRSAVRCGDELFLAESQGKVRRVNLATGAQAQPIGDGTILPLSIAADCPNERIVVLSPAPRPRRGVSIVTFRIDTGGRLSERQIPVTTIPAPVSHVVNGDLYLGNVTVAVAGEQLMTRPAATFFTDVMLGTRLSLDSETSALTFPAYDRRCPAAGACFETSLDTRDTQPRKWIVAQSASREVGIYSAEGGLERTFSVASPRFIRTGQELVPSDSPEARLRWSAANSRIYAVYVFGSDTTVVVHSRAVLATGWSFGQPVQWNAWMNVYTADGRQLISDIRLPELPLGHDDSSIYVADYGKDGRAGAAESVRIVRIPVRTDRTAFK